MKYMYTLSAAQQANFLSVDFMAVSPNSNPGSDQSNVISAAVDGSIDVIKIKSVGSGGTNGTHTNIPIRGMVQAVLFSNCIWCCNCCFSY